jgi:hypothetical protein
LKTKDVFDTKQITLNNVRDVCKSPTQLVELHKLYIQNDSFRINYDWDMDKLMEVKYSRVQLSHVRHGSDREWYDQWQIDQLQKEGIMAMPMMDNDRPGRSVDETYAENQHGLERSTRTNEITGRFINHSLQQIQSMMTDKKPLPDWVNELSLVWVSRIPERCS